WSLSEVIRDYRILRLVVLDYLDECLDRPLRLAEIQAIGLALDEAIEVSVERYVRNREDEFRQLEHSVRTQADTLRDSDPRRHELSVSLPDEPLCVEADQSRLIQVFVNLLNNAAKFTPEGGRISLHAAREGENVVVRVKDNGVGIAAAMLPHIFELFTQIDA